MKETKFGKIKVNTDGVPSIEVLIMDEGIVTNIGYLLPFMDYRFQISKTADECVDLGSSEAIGLIHCKVVEYNSNFSNKTNFELIQITKELLRGQIAIAVSKFCNTYKAVMPNLYTYTDESNRIDGFIELCYRSLRIMY